MGMNWSLCRTRKRHWRAEFINIWVLRQTKSFPNFSLTPHYSHLMHVWGRLIFTNATPICVLLPLLLGLSSFSRVTLLGISMFGLLRVHFQPSVDCSYSRQPGVRWSGSAGLNILTFVLLKSVWVLLGRSEAPFQNEQLYKLQDKVISITSICMKIL